MDSLAKSIKLRFPAISAEIRDIIAGSVLISFSIFSLFSSFPIKKTIVSKIGSEFFPSLISLMMLAIGIYILVSSVIRHIRCRKGIEGDKDQSAVCEDVEFDSSIVLTPLLILTYFAITVYLGFIVATILYLYFQIRILHNGKMNRLPVLMLSVGFTLFIYFGFILGFRLYLPFGVIPGLIW